MRRAGAALLLSTAAALGGCAWRAGDLSAQPASGAQTQAPGGADSISGTTQTPRSAVTTVQAQAAQQFSGRLSLRVHQPRNGATDGGSLVFDFDGTAEQGTLVLQTVIGTAVATARWGPLGAEIVTPNGRREGASLDDVASALLGQSLPLAALLHWIRAEPWSQAPHRRHAEGFEQLGWTISLNAWHERVVTAHRSARADSPGDVDITVRARLDEPATSTQPAMPADSGGMGR